MFPNGGGVDCRVRQTDCSGGTVSNSEFTRRWFINGNDANFDERGIRILQPGTYTCEITHRCGVVRSVLASIPRGKFKQELHLMLFL